jgi:hypothetical protein
VRTFQVLGPLVDRSGKAEHFFKRLPLDPQAKQEGPQFKIGDAAIKDGSIQLVGIVGSQIPGTLRAATNFLDVLDITHCLLLPRSNQHGLVEFLVSMMRLPAASLASRSAISADSMGNIDFTIHDFLLLAFEQQACHHE